MPIRAVRPTHRFTRDYRRLPVDVTRAVDEALDDLLRDPVPNKRRFHRLSDHTPPIFVIDVFTNHSWQITFTLEGDVATLRRVARHTDVDRNPR